MNLCRTNGLCNWRSVAVGRANGGLAVAAAAAAGRRHRWKGGLESSSGRLVTRDLESGAGGSRGGAGLQFSDGMRGGEARWASKAWQGGGRRTGCVIRSNRRRVLWKWGPGQNSAVVEGSLPVTTAAQNHRQHSLTKLLRVTQKAHVPGSNRGVRRLSARNLTASVLDKFLSSQSSGCRAGGHHSGSVAAVGREKRELGGKSLGWTSSRAPGGKQQPPQLDGRRRRWLRGGRGGIGGDDGENGVECKGVAVIGEAVVAAAASRPSHAAALATVTKLAVTAAAVVYGAFFSPYAHGLIGQNDKNAPAALAFDGVDVTGYKIFEHLEVQKAITYARDAHEGQMRKTGEPYITHCIHTARILAALVPSQGSRAVHTVVAGILHDVVDDTVRDLRDLRKEFGDDVASLVQGVSKLSNINQLLRRHRRHVADQHTTKSDGLSPAEVDSLRVMLLGMVNDPRVVLIKLADRLHNMRTIYALPPSKASAVAQETLAVWCSLASRLGVWAVKAELEDLCFAVLQPKTFRQLRAGLAAIWSPDKDWRYLRRFTKRAKRRAVLHGDLELGGERKPDPEDEEELSMKDLLEAVAPFDVLDNRSRRCSGLNCLVTEGIEKKTKVVKDAEVALASLGACEEALDKELLISTSYVPGMEVTLSGRLKSLYSTHCKMRRKGVGVDEVYDARALRVVVGDGGGKLHVAAVEGCYSLLNLIHRLWTPVGGEFDDYIVNPKRSGYQSLHTAVRGPDGAPLEVQIRTQGMHEYAEFGHAAHWLYKEGDSAIKSMILADALLSSPTDGNGGPIIGNDDHMENMEINRYAKEFKPSRTAERAPPSGAQLGHPALRIEDGRLLAAVIVRVDDDGRELLVAVSFSLRAREAVAAGRARNQRKRWEAYALLYKKVSQQWWSAPGHGDWSTCLERYTLCSDGMYHKQDQFERVLPAFIQLLDLNEREQEDYQEVMDMVREGREVSAGNDLDIPEDYENSLISQLQSGVSTTRLNNKVRLLRSMLQWEQELRHEASLDGSVTVLNPDHPNSVALTEVLVIRWPDGEIMRMPAGSTAADAARRLGWDGNVVYINSQIALPHASLKDGDLVEIR